MLKEAKNGGREVGEEQSAVGAQEWGEGQREQTNNDMEVKEADNDMGGPNVKATNAGGGERISMHAVEAMEVSFLKYAKNAVLM